MIAITFALPEESRDFCRRLAAVAWTAQVRVTHSGTGLTAAAAQAGRILAERPEMLIIAGFAGGLDPALRVGDLVVATNFSSPAPLAAARKLSGAHFGSLASVALPVESVAAKKQLAQETGALAVDMETAPIAAACTGAGVPLLSCRVISDPATEPLPVPFSKWFDLERQRPRPVALLGYLATHPSAIPSFARFVRGLRPARTALGSFLIEFLSLAMREAPSRNE